MPESGPDQFGPRLSDLRPQSSEYGRPIPIVYGTAPVQGNVIWAIDLIPVETTTEVGGKGTPSQSVTNTTYLANFAVSICEGERDVLRIWSGPDKRLIYDGFNVESGTIRIYRGDEDQLPDALIESYEGVGNVPAYRGTCYVVFENFDCSNDFNRAPTLLQFEVTQSGGTIFPSYTNVTAEGTPAKLYDPAPEYITTYTSSVSGPHNAVADTVTGKVYVLRRRTSDNLWFLDRVNPSTLEVEATLSIGSYGALLMALDPSARMIGIIESGTTTFITVSLGSFTASVNAFDVAKCDIVYCGPGAFSDGRYSTTAAGSSGFVTFNATNVTTIIGGVTVDHPDNFGFTGVRIGGYLVACGDRVAACNSLAGGTRLGAGFIGDAGQIFDVYDSRRRRLVRIANAGSAYYDITSGDYVQPATQPGSYSNVVYNPYVDRIFAGPTSFNPAEFDASAFPSEGDIFSGAMAYGDLTLVGTNYYMIPVPLPGIRRAMLFISGIDITGDDDVFVFYLGQGGGVLLSDVVADLSERADANVAYNVDALTDTVDGYVIARQTTVRAAIDTLRPVYFFDAVESSGVVKYVKRGGAVAATIEDGELGAYVSGGSPIDPLETVRQMEVELPKTVNVSYLSAATEYETATKTAKRLIGSSTDEVTIEAPLVLSDTKAQEVAQVNLHGPWVQRLTYKFSLPRKYSYLEPTDLILAGGYLMRLVKITATPQGILQCEAVADDTSYYEPHVVVTETPETIKTVYVPGATVLELA